jgi:hypothetical protein
VSKVTFNLLKRLQTDAKLKRCICIACLNTNKSERAIVLFPADSRKADISLPNHEKLMYVLHVARQKSLATF